jgi:transposase-like protein
MRKERTHYTAEEKVAILRRHLLDKIPVSDLCEENGLQPTVFYRWQKEFFENGAAAFQAKERPARQVEEKQKRIEYLEKKVQTKDEVLAELMAEHVALKKSLGVAAKLAGSLAGESPAGGSLPSYPRSDIRRRRG